MKKLTVAILSMVLVAGGAMFVFAQDGAANKDGKRGFGKRGFHRGGRHGMMLRGLDLTDEQKAQIKTIMQASKENSKPLREQVKATREKLQMLAESGNFDQARIQALADEQGKLTAQMIVEKEKVKSQISAILTAEQKAKAAEMKAQFKQKREERMRKRADRRAAQAEQKDSTK